MNKREKLKIGSFGPGGISFDGMKLTVSSPVVKAHMPSRVMIPMSEYKSVPATAVVRQGQNVVEGDVIGEAGGIDSAPVHASVSGRIVSVEKVKGWDYHETTLVTITTGGIIKNWYGKKSDISGCTPEQMLSDIRKAGIVGLDGSGIPAHIKLSPGRTVAAIIINSVESSPYLTVERSLMLEKIDEIILGTRLIMKITGAGKAVIAIGAGDDEAASLLAGKLDGDSSVRPVMLKNKYPQGNERLLARSIFKKESPSFIACNVSNVYAVYEAVIFKKPLIERYVTYTGDAAPGRGNYKIRIGTPISFLTGESGMPLKECRIIAGDVMTGYDVTVIDMPLTKGIAGIVVMPDKKNYSVRDLSCIRCSRCVLVCPMRLNPYELSRLCREDLVEEAAGLRLNDCIECGCCSYSCPSSIPLAAVIRHGKNLLEARVGLL